MLLKFGAKNFFSFKEGFELSLELGAKCPISISKGRPTSNLLCVKGTNASGKTNALKVLGFLSYFCCDSFNEKPEEEIEIASFFNNEDPTHLFCNFQIDDTIYIYELVLTEKGIISEKLQRKKKRLSPAFERKYNKIVYCTEDFSDLKNIKQRSNASIISTANQYEARSISQIYDFFNSITANVGAFGKIDIALDYRSISEFYNNHRDVLSEAIRIIKSADLGISNIEINVSKQESGADYYFPTFDHDAEVEQNWLTFHDESLGTQTLYKTLPYLIKILKSGGILVLDEFDTDLHPDILQLLISYFDNEDINVNNSQIIFSTHNTEILEFMGKYRTVIVNKDSSESFAYRLDEIPGDILRNDRLIVPIYKSGKIGGVPRL